MMAEDKEKPIFVVVSSRYLRYKYFMLSRFYSGKSTFGCL